MPGSTRAFATSDPRSSAWSALATPGSVVGLALTVSAGLVAVLAPAIAPVDPFVSVGPALTPPSTAHLLGTDDLGRDLLAGIVHGARTSLLVALGVTLLAAFIGIAVGAASGYWPGAVDDLLMRGTELVQVVPRFFLAVVVIALFGPGLDRMILVLGLTSWPTTARIVRAQTLALRRHEFVDAARSLGASAVRILLRHVLPSALPAVIVVISLNIASVILLEAGLGFIGLGDPRAMSWGYLANNAQRFLRVAWWMAAFPGAAIALAVLGLNLLGDALNDVVAARRPRGRPPRAWRVAGR